MIVTTDGYSRNLYRVMLRACRVQPWRNTKVCLYSLLVHSPQLLFFINAFLYLLTCKNGMICFSCLGYGWLSLRSNHLSALSYGYSRMSYYDWYFLWKLGREIDSSDPDQARTLSWFDLIDLHMLWLVRTNPWRAGESASLDAFLTRLVTRTAVAFFLQSGSTE